MSNEDVKAAAAALTAAMSGLVRAIDALGDEAAAVKEIPEALPGELERLAARLNAAGGFGD
jgi:phage-related minor tail protein